MRQQFLPLALCLLCAMMVLQFQVVATNQSTQLSAKTLAITAFKTKNKKPSKKTKISEISMFSDLNSERKSVKTKPTTETDELKEISQFEEISYNLTTSDGALVEDLSKKSEIAVASAQLEQTATFGEGLFYGFAIMVILLNMICYFLFDEKMFLYYSLSLLTVSGLLFFSDGLLPLVGLDGFATSASFESLLVLSSCIFGSWFATNYLNIQEVIPKMKWISLLLLSSSAILVLMSALSGVVAFASAANVLAFSVISLYFLAGVYLFSKKNYPKFYVIAYSIPLLFAIDYFVFRNLGLEFLMTQPGHIKAAVLVEMLLLTYAIVYRMRAIKEENELRQTEIRIFLKRQEIMNRKNAMQLMEDVYLENLIMHYDLDGFEIKLLQYISEGKDNAKIARKLKTTEAEIEELSKELYHKLEISEQIQEDYRMVDAQADYIYN